MSGSVIRGLALDAAPLRLARGREESVPLIDEDDATTRMDQVFAEAAKAGFAEGLRQGRAEGLAAGSEEGLRTGREEAQRQCAEMIAQAVATATDALAQERSRLRDLQRNAEGILSDCAAAAEDDLVALCYETICRVVTDAALRPECVRATLVRAAAAASEQARVVLHVHADDAVLLERAGWAGGAAGPIAWRADPTVALGGCIVRSAAGGLDARLETLLAGCRDALLRAREARS